MGDAKAVATPAALQKWHYICLQQALKTTPGFNHKSSKRSTESGTDEGADRLYCESCNRLWASVSLPAAVPMAVKSLWSASFLKNPPKAAGHLQPEPPPQHRRQSPATLGL